MFPTKPDRILERKSRIFALFSDPTRVRILRFLAKKPKTSVSSIARHVGMSLACVSHHLQLLKDNLIAVSLREGNTIHYSLKKSPLVKKLIALIK